MVNIKKYRVEHGPTSGAMIVSINYDFSFKYGDRLITMDESIKDMAMFWADSENRLDENLGSHLDTFLKYLCETVLLISSTKNYNEAGVIDEFKGMEGWCGLDGSGGVKLISLDQMELDHQDDYEINLIQ